ncbi:MAG: IclR family transcriptional regulator [Candidatus Puniceispirillaceae bacterium]
MVSLGAGDNDKGRLMPDDMLEKRSGHTQSVSRALRLLSRLSEEPNGMTLSELARGVGLAPSTAHRLLTTLQLERFVRFEDSRWLVGVQAFHVGASYMRARDVCFMARPYLRMLMQDTGETANLALIEDEALVYLAQVESAQMMRALAKPGVKAPWSCSAVGKACLAFTGRPEAERLIASQGIVQMTANSHVTANSLWEDIAQVQNRYYAFDDEEHSPGLRCVASPLFDSSTNVIGALSISGPSVRVSQNSMAQIGKTVSRIARELTQALGGQWPTG